MKADSWSEPYCEGRLLVNDDCPYATVGIGNLGIGKYLESKLSDQITDCHDLPH
jgi:hypothetical protein